MNDQTQVSEMPQRYGIIVSRFNGPIVEEMLQGALEAFDTHGVSRDLIDIQHVPGAFELPVVATAMAATERYRGIIALGTVIRGDTAHFEYVSGACAHGLSQVGIEYMLPVIFGVLTTDTVEQALERAERSRGNKGFEMAMAAMETADVLDQVVNP
jgi:6,7-dimethyl-8-ribityllumazine synthase